MKALVSIHDVAPHNLETVGNLITRLPAPCRDKLVLLVIPGHNWQPHQVEQLQRWQSDGITLAGHGWHHNCQHLRGWYHRLHSQLISRNAAEHLSLKKNQILELLSRNRQWFINNNLEAPDLYVPPAWAMGAVSGKELQASPFRYFETTRGIFDARYQRWKTLPLAGFEADTRLRALTLGLWNRLNTAVASTTHPLRISIHPGDAGLYLREEMWAMLEEVEEGCGYGEVFL